MKFLIYLSLIFSFQVHANGDPLSPITVGQALNILGGYPPERCESLERVSAISGPYPAGQLLIFGVRGYEDGACYVTSDVTLSSEHGPIDEQPDPAPETNLFDRTSKQQMLGCLTRWDNQLNSGSFTTVLNSLSLMFSDKDKINYCIEDIRILIGAQ